MKAVTLGFCIWMLVLIVALCSCTTYDRTLHNEEGQWYQCKATGYGIVGTITATQAQDNCEAKAHKLGYN